MRVTLTIDVPDDTDAQLVRDLVLARLDGFRPLPHGWTLRDVEVAR